MSQAQRNAMQSYKGTGSSSINKSLEYGTPTAHALAMGKGIMQHGKVIPQGTNLWRYFDLGPNAWNELKNAGGYAIQQPSIVGTSVRKDWGWSGNVKMKLIVGPDVRGLYVGNHFGSQSEREMFLPPNTRFVVQSTKVVGSKLHVEAFVLPTVSWQCC